MPFAHPGPAARARAAALPALRFAALCATAFLLAVGWGLYWRGFAAFPRTAITLGVLALPPALVAGIAAFAIDVLRPGATRPRRGILMASALAVFGPPASALAFAFVYRETYPFEPEPLWTELGLHQFAWTGLSTLYMFLLTGLRLYLPFGPLAVIAVAAWFARRPRR